MKKIIAMMLCLLMLVSVCACSKKENTEPQTPTQAATQAPTKAPDTTTPAPDADSDKDNTTVTDTPEPEPAKEITITDMIGREMTVVPGSYKRVVCIGAGALRMYTYIADVNLLCGVEDIENTTLEERPKMFDAAARPYVIAFGDVFNTLPSCGVGGPNAQAAEAEKILACEPDIVISEYEDVEKEDALAAQLGVPVVTMKAGPAGVFADEFGGSMRLLGTIFGEEEKAEALIAYVAAERAEIEKRVASVSDSDKPGVYICGLGNWGTTNHLMTAQNYINFNVANIKNVVNDLEKNGIQAIEAEKFTALGDAMDIIIIDSAAVKNIKPAFAEDPTMFDTCKAWQDGEVYIEMAYNAYYTNFELALANTWFAAKTAYPALFEDIDMTAKTNEITKAFLGKELAAEIFAKPASFGGYGKIDTETFFN
ncbi:MAG: ABC transporter substrate-binding protein [Lachnospiraceae bacterium]|nr:ABC transporter substrate-binding protein [Lachnospiraceae bacterium]